MQKRLAKEARAQEIQAKNIALGKKVKDLPTSKSMKGRGEASFYRVTCKVWFFFCLKLILISIGYVMQFYISLSGKSL